MALSQGALLGPYQIIQAIGAGGMGEVYRAKDTRLDRTVAIKVLASDYSRQPEQKQRFDREARTISSLSHPHICPLYDIGHQDGIDYLVMEFLEGQTLAERLTKGALTTDIVLRYGIQISSALDAAHKQGIVHRDLKPGNIMITKSGVKLLDFGLAKLQSPLNQELLSGVSVLPTEQHHLTVEGTIIGTLAYMAPEQLEAGQADSRTDIFALGTVLYEMATGKRAFTGKSQASLIAAIVSSDPPPISTIQPMMPRELDRVVRTCMSKDPDDRWQTAHDVMLELKWIAEGGSQSHPQVAISKSKQNRERFIRASVLVLAVLLSILTTLALRPTNETKSQHVVEVEITVPDRLLFGASRTPLAISPDGERIVYDASPSANPAAKDLGLYLRSLDRPEAKLIVEGGSRPFFSPDGQFIGFYSSDGKMKMIPLKGGSANTICQCVYNGASWGENGNILFAEHRKGLFIVPASGGVPKLIYKPDKSRGEIDFQWPQWIPGTNAILFTLIGNPNSIALLRLKNNSPLDAPQILFQGDIARYLPPGFLIYGKEEQLYSISFDPKELKIMGLPVEVLDHVASFLGILSFDVSNEGTLAYAKENYEFRKSNLKWVSRSGVATDLDLPPQPYTDPNISNDGKKLVFASRLSSKVQQVWSYDLDKGTITRLTFGNKYYMAPVWSPDDKRLVYVAAPVLRSFGLLNFFSMPSDGNGSETLMLSEELHAFPTSWSPDGRVLAIMNNTSGNQDIDLLNCKVAGGEGGDCKLQPYLVTEYNEFHPMISPDGRWLAYTSDESGLNEIYVQSFPEIGRGKWQISVAGGSEPRWSRESGELFFRQENKMMVVKVTTSPTFSASKPTMLFEEAYQDTGWVNDYDVSADGQRFLMMKSQSLERQAPIHLILNFTEKIKSITAKAK